MPELPEVETSLRGIAPYLIGQRVTEVRVRQAKLRWPVTPEIPTVLPGKRLVELQRRGKYLLFSFTGDNNQGTLILHLGMSGSLRILDPSSAVQKHDHFELVFETGKALRLRDPRRFSAVLWTTKSPLEHPLLKNLGPEPLEPGFTGDLLQQQAGHRRVAVKNLVMDSRVVVGVGNIYANEALFRAGIHPKRRCDRISRDRYQNLAQCIVQVLQEAIAQGGTTLQDFQREDGRPGYFAQQLRVYGRTGEPCPDCGSPILQATIGQRSAFFCSHCQR